MKKLIWVLLSLLLISPVAAEEIENDYYKLAKEYIGARGDCYQVATNFLRDFYNDESFKISTEEIIDYDDAVPGDVIFYERSSIGTVHWAVYLGNDLALQGNWRNSDGTYSARIDSIYLEGGSAPIFYKQNESIRNELLDFSFKMIEVEF